ncbi:Gfo/Idh/MocA family protein [Sutcliffiella rhizosphaerae]|uniref:Glucose--fructose oxidoreductase n=1 Tax=Sutcliffiella rhizosphaerae TaxID=2880967 RepID=A0ABM8YTA5_9BACI|nr:Gfo/Idh/MocA family oxidoreductase [Sutcliffiella rhizosphaerae]CAG9623249.1 Glucose--fructose oxidoreductase [Sutcliffiella rhizosphaerae]
MRKIKMGIIGVGGIAQNRHIPTFLKMKDKVEIVAISDVNEATAKSVGERFGISQVYAHYTDMFPEVDAVTICTPNKFHAEISIGALEAGLHVFCEKPMAMRPDECEAMVAAAEKSGKLLAIAYHYRFMKESIAGKQLVTQGDIGRPMVARAKGIRRRKVPGWGVFTNKELQGGGSLIDYGCHLLDLSLWLLGNPKPVEVMGTSYNELSKIPGQVNQWGSFDHTTFEVDDHVTAYIKFENGASMLFETSWSANVKGDEEAVSISGVEGGVDLFPFHFNQVKHGMLLNSEADWLPGEDDPSLPQAQNFINSCLGLEELVVRPEQAMQVSFIIDAIYRSSETGKSVSL